ncbi:MAG: hypothetical protein HY664_01555 [Chloroflexi bacterium]|nr:hypothetical protein [Chloroflexota bacterium]
MSQVILSSNLKSIIKRGWLLVLALVLVLPASPVQSQTIERIGKIRWAYYVAYDANSLGSLKEHIDSLDYVSPFWFQLDDGGNLNNINQDDFDGVAQFVQSRGVKLVPTVKNGATGGAFHSVLADPALRTQTIGRLVELAMSRGYDGLHIDFENLDSGDRPHLSAFMAELAAALRSRGKLVSQAVAAKEEEKTTGWAGVYDYSALAPSNDLIVLMAYGYRTASSSVPGSTAPILWVEKSVAYAASQIPADKLILGVPWWGYDWNLTIGPPATSLRYAQSIALAQQHGAAIAYDEASQGATFSYNSGGQNHQVWFENRRSLDAKLDLVFKYGLAGAAGWRLGHEDPEAWASFDARLGFRTWFFAEGATATPYHTWILMLNPNPYSVQAKVTFMKEDGSTVIKNYTLRPTSRFNLFVNAVVPNAALSTKVEADATIFVERAMYFGHDGHVSAGVNAPRYNWYLPEGFTGPGFHTWLLLMNPNPVPSPVTLTFMKEDGSTVVKSYTLGPTSRLNIWANEILPNSAFATEVSAQAPVVAERATYFDGGKGGHGSVGSTYTSKQWQLAEGYTGFDSWLLFMNPNPVPAQVTMTLNPEGGQPVVRTFNLKPSSRFNIYTNSFLPPNTPFATTVTSDQPIVLERSMYWGSSLNGHSSLAATAPSTTWFLAEGATAYPFEEWVFISNPGSVPTNANLTFMKEDGTTLSRNYNVAARSRITVHVDDIVPDSALSIRVDSDQPIVVERTMYFGIGGTNSLGMAQ